MNTSQIILFAVTGFFLLLLVVLTPYLVARSVREGMKNQQELAARVSSLPMRRMLKARRIPPGEYLLRESSARIGVQIERCESCDQIEQCDHHLTERSGPGDDKVDFCPNNEDFQKIAKRYGR